MLQFKSGSARRRSRPTRIVVVEWAIQTNERAQHYKASEYKCTQPYALHVDLLTALCCRAAVSQ